MLPPLKIATEIRMRILQELCVILKSNQHYNLMNTNSVEVAAYQIELGKSMTTEKLLQL